jgi:hypothetical protein
MLRWLKNSRTTGSGPAVAGRVSPGRGSARPGALSYGHLNDFVRGLSQQMFYWGRDVMADANLLLEFGFQKRASTGLQGTSCYRAAWRGGWIELHGACAGWYADPDGAAAAEQALGFLFIRVDQRCYGHRLREAVVPGSYPYKALIRSRDLVMEQAQFFAQWLVEYELWVRKRAGEAYRWEGFKQYRELPKSKAWLPPDQDLNWLRGFAAGDGRLPRFRRR